MSHHALISHHDKPTKHGAGSPELTGSSRMHLSASSPYPSHMMLVTVLVVLKIYRPYPSWVIQYQHVEEIASTDQISSSVNIQKIQDDVVKLWDIVKAHPVSRHAWCLVPSSCHHLFVI
jgi:hypothetical protein